MLINVIFSIFYGSLRFLRYSLEELMFKEKPSLMMEAFEKHEYFDMYCLSLRFGQLLKEAALDDKQKKIDDIVCHVMSETKYEADRLRGTTMYNNGFDYVAGVSK